MRFLLFCCLVGISVPLAARYETQFHVTRDDVESFLGTSRAKLVYTNRRNGFSGENAIEYVNFAEEPPTARRLENVDAGFLPIISPDGRRVVYTDTYHGEAGGDPSSTSSIYICELSEDAEPVRLVEDYGHEPRFVYNTEALGPEYDKDNLMVVYPTKSPDGAWNGIGRTMIVEIDTTGGIAKVDTSLVLFEGGSFTGGLSYDGSYLCGGGGHVAIFDRRDGSIDTVGPARARNGDRLSGQACNASICPFPIRTDHVMFLDFGSGSEAYPEINGGRSWFQWQIIFIAGENGELLAHYRAPTDNPAFPFEIEDSSKSDVRYYQPEWTRWHHPEWSTHPDFAVATVNVRRLWGFGCNGGLVCSSEKQERIYVINLRTGEYLDVLGPALSELHYDQEQAFDGLYWPHLWVDQTPPVPVGKKNSKDSASPKTMIVGKQLLHVNTGARSVSIYSMQGRLVRSIRLPTAATTCSLGDLKPGAYTIAVENVSGRVERLRHLVSR